jgi:hypothetical protein
MACQCQPVPAIVADTDTVGSTNPQAPFYNMCVHCAVRFFYIRNKHCRNSGTLKGTVPHNKLYCDFAL